MIVTTYEDAAVFLQKTQVYLEQNEALNGWQFCTLFTDLANLTSNSIYQKIGYKPVGDFNDYVFITADGQ